jgi:hypothetical protein
MGLERADSGMGVAIVICVISTGSPASPSAPQSLFFSSSFPPWNTNFSLPLAPPPLLYGWFLVDPRGLILSGTLPTREPDRQSKSPSRGEGKSIALLRRHDFAKYLPDGYVGGLPACHVHPLTQSGTWKHIVSQMRADGCSDEDIQACSKVRSNLKYRDHKRLKRREAALVKKGVLPLGRAHSRKPYGRPYAEEMAALDRREHSEDSSPPPLIYFPESPASPPLQRMSVW